MTSRIIPIAALLALSAQPSAAGEAQGGPQTRIAAVHMVEILTRTSPNLSATEKRAISQDIHGAPLSGPAGVHVITANQIFCRKRVIDGGAPAVCHIDFGGPGTRDLNGRRGEALYAALGEAGVEDDAGMGHIVRAVTNLVCRVDDHMAQTTPATGDDVAGVSCQFKSAD